MKRALLISVVLGLGAAGLNAQARSVKRVQSPETWGSSAGYTMIMHYQFHGANPAQYRLVNHASQGSFCEGDATAECLGYAQVDAPEGAILEKLDIWGFDNSDDSDMHYNLIASCDGANGQAEIILDQNDLPGQSGDFHYSSTFAAPGFSVDNSQCGYTLRIKFTDGGEPPRGELIRIRKARLTWRRQVSPAPETATFADVPIDHQFFQYVEALAKSGITGGCGPGIYCPDAPLTRGQMAVFLAKALGLQWPEGGDSGE